MSTDTDVQLVTVNVADLRDALQIIADQDIEDIDDEEMAVLYRLEAAAGVRIWVPTRDMRAAEFVANVPGLDLEQAYQLVDYLEKSD